MCAWEHEKEGMFMFTHMAHRAQSSMPCAASQAMPGAPQLS